MTLGGGALVVSSALILPLRDAHVGFWILALFVGTILAFFGVLGWSTGLLVRHTQQTCPECLSAMTRGATTCPHCRFHAPKEAVCAMSSCS